MFNFKKFLTILAFFFLIGAFICSFFMYDVIRYTYSSYANRYITVYDVNEFAPAVTSLVSTSLTATLIAIPFSFIKKKGFCVVSIVMAFITTVLCIVAVVFAGISIAKADNEGASIVATVFIGITIGASILTLLVSPAVLKRINQESGKKVYLKKRYDAPAPSIFKPTTKPEVENNNNKNNDTSIDDIYNEIKKIKELLDSGAITQEEFDRLKARILN